MNQLHRDMESAQFRATSSEYQAFGATPRQALDRLMRLLPPDASGPIIIWPFNRGDAFFTEAQQARLEELKSRSDRLTDLEREELDSLIEAAFDATIARTQSLKITKS
jgi:hypothetical protein